MFDVDLTDPDIWKFITDHMHSTYKEWKAKFHRHYKQYASDPDLARETPPPEKIFGTRRTLEEWHYLVDTLYTNEQYQKKMNEEYEKAKQQVAESSGTPLDQVTLPIPQQLEIMTVELGVAKGKRIRGLGSSLRVESSHSGGVASSFATQQKVEELQGTVSELQGTVGKLLDVIEWMRTHDGPLPSHIGVLSSHVGDSPCDYDQGNSGGSRNVYENLIILEIVIRLCVHT
ncbi:uncharacterized protein LOC110760658 isoform X2 [Prunus avium]|uniref:Uncharacterized protein LOC110760658 isoform X2 n=1 Tax=Prunus avium TaxID=42229 RepID=A0A6P5SR79_PRUAV|nr:uncharacterized protein LOC110760658 isoform X2 [Prunus avium]